MTTSTHADLGKLGHLFAEIMSGHDVSRFDEIKSPAYVNHNAFAEPGLEGSKQVLGAIIAAVPDLKVTAEAVFVSDGRQPRDRPLPLRGHPYRKLHRLFRHGQSLPHALDRHLAGRGREIRRALGRAQHAGRLHPDRRRLAAAPAVLTPGALAGHVRPQVGSGRRDSPMRCWSRWRRLSASRSGERQMIPRQENGHANLRNAGLFAAHQRSARILRLDRLSRATSTTLVSSASRRTAYGPRRTMPQPGSSSWFPTKKATIPSEVAQRYIQSPEAANDARGFNVADILNVDSTILMPSPGSPAEIALPLRVVVSSSRLDVPLYADTPDPCHRGLPVCGRSFRAGKVEVSWLGLFRSGQESTGGSSSSASANIPINRTRSSMSFSAQVLKIVRPIRSRAASMRAVIALPLGAMTASRTRRSTTLS